MKQSKIVDKSKALLDALIAFYAQFKQNATVADIRSVFLRVNLRKVKGPGRVPGHVLVAYVDQLVEVFADIFNLSLLQSKVPSCFKKTTIIPISKKTHATCLNDYHP
eukprot:g30288.t1